MSAFMHVVWFILGVENRLAWKSAIGYMGLVHVPKHYERVWSEHPPPMLWATLLSGAGVAHRLMISSELAARLVIAHVLVQEFLRGADEKNASHMSSHVFKLS